MNSTLFEDTLDVRQLNVDGKKFERVNRLHCKSNDFDVDVVLGTAPLRLRAHWHVISTYVACADVNCELFDARSGDVLKFVLARYELNDNEFASNLFGS